jgi:hypothetical protein
MVCFFLSSRRSFGDIFAWETRTIACSWTSNYVTADQTAWFTTAPEEIQERDNFIRTGNMATVTRYAH